MTTGPTAASIVNAYFTEQCGLPRNTELCTDVMTTTWYNLLKAHTVDEADELIRQECLASEKAQAQPYNVHLAIRHHLMWWHPETFSPELLRQLSS